MDIYYDQTLECNTTSVLHVAAEWHLTSDLLAVASVPETSDEGFVCIYNDQGTLITKAVIPGEGAKTQIEAIRWHPSRKVLVVACDGGDLFCWNDDEQIFLSSSSHHTTSVSVLQWSPTGIRLVSADESGTLVGWTLDSKGQLEVVFHVELKDRLSQVVFCGENNVAGGGIHGLARAAVSGSEEALDQFNVFGHQNQIARSQNEPFGGSDASFYVGAMSGIVYLINSENNCVEVASCAFPVIHLLDYRKSNQLVAIDSAPSVIQYQVKFNGMLDELSRTKIAGQNLQSDVAWTGNGILAMMTGELSIRILDLKNGDTYTLDFCSGKPQTTGERLTSLGYTNAFGILMAGTNHGNIKMWKYTNNKLELEKQWVVQGTSVVKGAVKQLGWSSVNKYAVVNTSDNVYMLVPKPASCRFRDQIAAIQLSARSLAVELFPSYHQIKIQGDIPIQGLDVSSQHVALWSGQAVVVHEFSSETLRTHQVGNFPSTANIVRLKNQNLYVLEGGKVQVKTFQGTIKQSLGFLEVEGQVSNVDGCGSYLIAVTSKGFFNIWEISRREAKPLTSTQCIGNSFKEFGKLTSVKVNCNGNQVSMLFEKRHHLVIWSVETNAFLTSDAIKNTSDNSCSWLETNEIVSHFWEPEEPRILVCELRAIKGSKTNGMLTEDSKLRIISFFVTSEYGIMIHDTLEVDDKMYIKLVGVRIPNYYATKWHEQSVIVAPEPLKLGSNSHFVGKLPMRDFVGLEEGDHSTRRALMNFSFNLIIGNMDEAFKSIKKIKCNDKVWENMARTCVKTKRLDVAMLCLGHMKNVKAIKALRKSENIKEMDARVAILAVHLGMLQEAEHLFEKCGRFDLLNQFCQASGQWNRAIEIAESNDRINLRTTYYNYARYLETKGDFAEAITKYQNSATHQYEVPRMLFDNPAELERFVDSKNDPKLFKWWAQYMESLGEMETALQYYEKAKDFLSLVRVYCYCNNLDKASEIANDTSDRAANYHLGRQYENRSDLKRAIHFFSKAQAYSHAIRICKDQGLDDQLLNLAVLGSKADMIDVASYYEAKGEQLDHAVMLYHKGGLTGKAIELAFRSNQRNVMEQLAHDLDENAEPRVLRGCAEYFIESGQPDQAIKLLAKAKDYQEAIDLCSEHNVPLTEAIVESLTPAKDSIDGHTRNRILEKIAECCYRQGNYHLATKKYTQAGNKVQAMKALLKSGDTERIVFFANVSRQTDIYIMAANYLQTLDWRNEPVILQNIVVFYTKGKAIHLLAGFYETCAQTEIEDFQDYGKALDALKEAHQCISGASTGARARFGENRLQQLSVKIEIVNAFLQAKRVYDRDPEESMKLCSALLERSNLEVGLRPGDIYGFMIEHYAKAENYKMAYNLINDLKSKMPNANLEYYIDRTALETIFRNLGIHFGDRKANDDRSSSAGSKTPYLDDEVVDESVS